MKPLLFVAMPFGKKLDSKGMYEIDFDNIYERAIKPAGYEADVEIIRADEEKSGGIIHIPMFERLLLAEIVIADLTIPNPNVFYELGVRHCAKPRSTILIFSKESRLPFDISPIRALPYTLTEGEISEQSSQELKYKLIELLKNARQDLETKDSPLFQLIEQFPGIDLPHDVTESFRERVKYINDYRCDLEYIRNMGEKENALIKLIKIEEELGSFETAPSELIIDLLLSYRDIEAWDEMIKLTAKIPNKIKNSTKTIKEQYAFALNRRNWDDDRNNAIHVMSGVIADNGLCPESCGILGRIYKDMYKEEKENGKKHRAKAYLNESKEWYYRGFNDDPRDFYPGINAATLAFISNDQEKLSELLPTVSFAVARRGGMNSKNYWEVATVLELAILGEDWEVANRALNKLFGLRAPKWNYKTTINNLEFIFHSRKEQGFEVENMIPSRRII